MSYEDKVVGANRSKMRGRFEAGEERAVNGWPAVRTTAGLPSWHRLYRDSSRCLVCTKRFSGDSGGKGPPLMGGAASSPYLHLAALVSNPRLKSVRFVTHRGKESCEVEPQSLFNALPCCARSRAPLVIR